MPLQVPPAINYASPLVSIPATWTKDAPEGPRMIPCEIDWGSANMGGPNNCVNINIQNNATANFSQIVALSVDNSASGADVQFSFPDTSQTYVIPAYTPAVVLEVFTGSTQFFVSAPNAIASDITRFAIHNALPPPIAVPVTQEQQSVVANNINAGVTATTQLVPLGTNGTIQDINVFAQLNQNATAGVVLFSFVDGTGKLIAGGQVGSDNAERKNTLALALSDIAVRFVNGLTFVVTATTIPAGSALAVNLYYRTP